MSTYDAENNEGMFKIVPCITTDWLVNWSNYHILHDPEYTSESVILYDPGHDPGYDPGHDPGHYVHAKYGICSHH